MANKPFKYGDDFEIRDANLIELSKWISRANFCLAIKEWEDCWVALNIILDTIYQEVKNKGKESEKDLKEIEDILDKLKTNIKGSNNPSFDENTETFTQDILESLSFKAHRVLYNLFHKYGITKPETTQDGVPDMDEWGENL